MRDATLYFGVFLLRDGAPPTGNAPACAPQPCSCFVDSQSSWLRSASYRTTATRLAIPGTRRACWPPWLSRAAHSRSPSRSTRLFTWYVSAFISVLLLRLLLSQAKVSQVSPSTLGTYGVNTATAAVAAVTPQQG